MEKKLSKEESLKLAMEIASKTIGFDIVPFNFEDTKQFEEFIIKVLGVMANVKGCDTFVDGTTLTVENGQSNEIK